MNNNEVINGHTTDVAVQGMGDIHFAIPMAILQRNIRSLPLGFTIIQTEDVAVKYKRWATITKNGKRDQNLISSEGGQTHNHCIKLSIHEV